MSKEGIIRRTVIMCDMGLDFEQLSHELGFDFKKHFRKELQKLHPLVEDGLVSLTEQSLTVSNLGRLLIRNIATVFDTYIGKDKAVYSKAV